MGIIRKSVPKHPAEDDRRSTPRTCASFADDVQHADPAVRRWGVRDLIDCPGASGILAARLWCEDDRSVREAILTALTVLGDEHAVVTLVECLRSETVSLRNEAIDAMKQLPLAVAPIMDALLTDANPDVRIFAVNILESLRHPQVEQWLITVIEHDAHLNVCATSVDLLGEVATEVSREPLLRLKARYAGEPYMQFATDIALRRISSASS